MYLKVYCVYGVNVTCKDEHNAYNVSTVCGVCCVYGVYCVRGMFWFVTYAQVSYCVYGVYVMCETCIVRLVRNNLYGVDEVCIVWARSVLCEWYGCCVRGAHI